MKSQKIWIGFLLFLLFVCIVILNYQEGFKNIDYDAENQLDKIVTKVLPENAICIRGAQCISGRCLETNNGTTYGYCAKPL
jgi:hypothetical protein